MENSRIALCVIVVLLIAKAESGCVPAELLPRDLSPWGMFLSATGVVKAVMLLLGLASVLTWTVCLSKSLQLIRTKHKACWVAEVLAQVLSLNAITDSLPKGSGPAGELIAAAADAIKGSAGANP